MAGVRPAHLARRGAMYLVRFRVPNDIALVIGVAEFRRSLHTSDPAKAKARCLAATTWFRATMENLRRMKGPTRADLERAAAAHFDRRADSLDAPRAQHGDFQELHDGYNIEQCRSLIYELDDQLKLNRFETDLTRRAAEFVSRIGYDFDQLDTKSQLIAQQLIARAERAENQLNIHMLTEPSSPFQSNDVMFSFPRMATVSAPGSIARTEPKASLSHATQAFLEMKVGLGRGDSQISELERAFQWLKEASASEAACDDVSKAQLRQFRDDLGRIDVRLRGQKAPFKDRLTDDPDFQIAHATSVRYWKSIQAFFSWCHAEGLIADDPAAGLKMEKPKGEVVRSPEAFSAAELQMMFRVSNGVQN